jgi:hypothetical protein
VRPAPKAKASVSRAHGGRLRLAYDVKRVKGQVVTFREISPSVTKTLGGARRPRLTDVPAVVRQGRDAQDRRVCGAGRGM